MDIFYDLLQIIVTIKIQVFLLSKTARLTTSDLTVIERLILPLVF